MLNAGRYKLLLCSVPLLSLAYPVAVGDAPRVIVQQLAAQNRGELLQRLVCLIRLPQNQCSSYQNALSPFYCLKFSRPLFLRFPYPFLLLNFAANFG